MEIKRNLYIHGHLNLGIKNMQMKRLTEFGYQAAGFDLNFDLQQRGALHENGVEEEGGILHVLGVCVPCRADCNPPVCQQSYDTSPVEISRIERPLDNDVQSNRS